MKSAESGQFRETVQNAVATLVQSGFRYNIHLILGIRGEDIKVDNLSLDTFKNNILQAKINDTEIMGNDNNLYFTFGNTNAVARVSKYDVKEIGETLSFIFETHHLHFFDPDTENALL